MASGLKKGEMLKGRNFALTIILGVFVAIMVIVLFNLLVSYVYEPPQYDKFCRGIQNQPYPVKYGMGNEQCGNCTFSKALQLEADNCTLGGGSPVYDYDSKGCTSSLTECNFCSKDLDNAMKDYNKFTFFIYAIIGFILIVIGLFITPLLIQIVTLPAGAVLVIQAAMANINDKLAVIITLALLIVAAVILALRKLK